MKKEKTVRTYQRRTKSGKMVTVREHKASYDAAEEARKASAKKAGAGSELSKKKAAVEENPLGFSADDYKEWYHWDMEDDPKNEAALRVEKALTKSMGKKAYNKYLEDMSNSYSARGHKKAHQALLDEHTASQKKQDAKSKVAAKDIVRDAKDSSVDKKVQKAADAAGFKIKPKGNGKYLIQMGTGKWRTVTGEDIISQSADEVSLHPSWKESKESKDSSKSSTTPKKKAKDSDLVEHYDQFNKKSMGKAVGDSFTFSEGRGKDKFTYDARFVTDGRGRYGYVVRDKSEGPDAKYYVGISDGYERHSQLPAGLRKAAEAQGLRFKSGEFVKSSDKPTSAKTKKEEPKSHRSSTPETSESYATLKKFEGSPYRMRISRNGDPMPGEKQKLAKWKAGNRKLKEYLSTPEGAADKESHVAKQKEKERKAEEKRKRDVAKWREKYTAEKKAKKEKFDAKVSELKGKGFKAKKRVTTKYTSYLKGVNTVLDCFVSPDKKSAYVYRSGETSPTLRKATAKELKIIIGEAKAKKPTKMR